MTRAATETVRPLRKVGICERCGREKALVCVIGEWRCVPCWGGGAGSVLDYAPTPYDDAVSFGEHRGSDEWVLWCADHWQDILAGLRSRYGSGR